MGKKDRIDFIEFRVSILNERYKKYCGKCKQPIDTKEGFIVMNISRSGEWSITKVNICPNCFNEFSKQKEVYERNKKQIYDEMVKKRIIKGLKK